jgi:hypothetical protein
MCTRLDDEIAALQAIYDEQFEEQTTDVVEPHHQRRIVKYKDVFCTLKLSIPVTYPTCGNSSVCVVNLTFQGTECKISSSRKLVVQRAIENIIAANASNETLFDVIEFVRGRSYLEGPIGLLSEEREEEDCGSMGVGEEGGAADDIEHEQQLLEQAASVFRMDTPVKANVTAPGSGVDLEIIHGEVTMERKSQFLAHLAFVTSMEEVEHFRGVIVSDKRYARATHNIFAYRFTCPRTGVIYHDNDDDGEDAAGGRLAELLRLMGADGVAVIVSRWFGGTLLGPDRFKFISNAARRLLEDHGVGAAGSGGGKKRGGSSTNAAKGKAHG